CLGFDDGELGIAIFEDVIGTERCATATVPFDAARSNEILASDAAAFDDAPTGRFEGGIDVFSAGFGFVRGSPFRAVGSFFASFSRWARRRAAKRSYSCSARASASSRLTLPASGKIARSFNRRKSSSRVCQCWRKICFRRLA